MTPRLPLILLPLFLTVGVSPLPAQSPQGDKVDVEKANQPDTLKILFVGNSYTFMWDMPGLLQKMAAQAPKKKKVFVHALTWGGQSLNFYWRQIEKKAESGNVETLLGAADWDVVVLQRWGDDQVAEIVPKFAELIHNKHPNAKILLYAWGGAGKKDEEAKPPEKLQEAHEKAAQKTGAIIVPVAWAWYQFRINHPGAQDVADDGWHPGRVRAYMTASALYATLFHESPVGLPVRSWQAWAPPEGKGKGKGQVTDEEAADLQQLAWDAVQKYSNDPFFWKHAASFPKSPPRWRDTPSSHQADSLRIPSASFQIAVKTTRVTPTWNLFHPGQIKITQSVGLESDGRPAPTELARFLRDFKAAPVLHAGITRAHPHRHPLRPVQGYGTRQNHAHKCSALLTLPTIVHWPIQAQSPGTSMEFSLNTLKPVRELRF
jgi:hypothetical protein